MKKEKKGSKYGQFCEICGQPIKQSDSVSNDAIGEEEGEVVCRKVHLWCANKLTDYQIKIINNECCNTYEISQTQTIFLPKT